MLNSSGFLRSKAARILTIVLVVQAGVLYGVARTETRPTHQALSSAPPQFGGWFQTGEQDIEPEVKEILKADDLLNRSYANVNFPVGAHLFVAYFDSQRAGQTPHSPKNCLPGSGWVPSESSIVRIDVPGRAEPVEANRYVVARGDAKSLVLYWYQSRDRVVASEYKAKFYVLTDALRYNRTDTALVRIVVPITSSSAAVAEAAAVDFVKSVFMPLRRHFPAT